MLLKFEEILGIHEHALRAGLAAKREMLLGGISVEYVAQLPTQNSPNEQLLSDLQKMNEQGAVAGGVPLARWLTTAAHLTALWPERQAFFRRFADEVAAAADGGGADETPAKAVLAGFRNERFVFQSDLLPFGFLAAADRTGRSVVRVIVPSIEDGTPRLASSGNPLRFFGTGWLIGTEHVITNHHVVEARGDGEGAARDDDFRLQALGAEVEFDFDAEGQETERFRVASLVRSDRTLDYAVLKLDQAPGRAPLPICTRPITFDGDAPLAVNIIQHPQGAPKQIAIRNNLAAALKGGDLAYFTDTDGGSSGSPVCNDRWEVLALHKAATRSMGSFSYQGKQTAWVNVGTRMDLIVADLQKEPEVWGAIGGRMV